MLYLAPTKYYDESGRLHFFWILEDAFNGNIPFDEVARISHNLQLLRPKEYKAIIKELWRDKGE